ncbi:sulfur carrier protein ThiS [Botrimarina hoheduenensis]|uniref:Sulfur carrier protein ThiS n=1 Tax=Botrimarina hoheduenensis TaxID=2528000 RepID=A0A5C5W071_9BACT|nr:sulfur carrier protein ThiS [Botrimarina hoheduenensis]TWT43449.1 Sulfur carrier protein ThiS [Botrimarina hoheduenensis]
MTLFVNGEQLEAPDGLTVAGLLEMLEVRTVGVAVERNLTVVPRAEHAATGLEPGDRIEVVTLVGGG